MTELQHQEDGSVIITLQKDLSEASDATAVIYSMTNNFRLDSEGKLISLTHYDFSKANPDDSFGTDAYEGPYRAVTYIQDTPAEELEKRIRETMAQVQDAQTVAETPGA